MDPFAGESIGWPNVDVNALLGLFLSLSLSCASQASETENRLAPDIPLLRQKRLTVVSIGASAWARIYRIDTEDVDGQGESYFFERTYFRYRRCWNPPPSQVRNIICNLLSYRSPFGAHVKAVLHRERESTSTWRMRSVVGNFIPKPVACSQHSPA